jgi:hypothetical protein
MAADFNVKSAVGGFDLISNSQIKILKEVMNDDPAKFPVKPGINVVCGKNLVKTRNWWKAILLVSTGESLNGKLQLRLYGWLKRNGVYKQAQKFNISIAPYIGDVINIMQLAAQNSGKDKIVRSLVNRINELERVITFSKQQRARLPELKSRLREFRSLIEKESVDEKEIHNFLKENTWMFGSNYEKMFKSEKILTIDSREDFLLKNFNGYYDVLELKLPRDNLFVKSGGKKLSFSGDLKDAVSQVMFYLAEIRTYYLSIKDQTGLDLYFPKGIVVIGRRKNTEIRTLQIHKEFLNKVDIWTYDDLIDNAQKTIKTYEVR